MKTFKIISITLLSIVLLVGLYSYIQLKRHGLIPRDVYETVPPDLPAFTRPAMLVLNKTNEYVHTEAIPAADAMLMRIAEEQGWDIFITDNAATHNPEVIGRFDLIVWNNVTGDVLTEEQQSALKGWLSSGGGWVGVHGSGGTMNHRWHWYEDTLIGTRFVGHTLNPQFQDADVLVADASLPLTAHLPSPWRISNEEWYAFDKNPREKNYEILLTIDENSYHTEGENWMGLTDHMEGEHPLAWRHSIGKGRVFYSSIGHQAETYSLPEYHQLISKAMVWAMNKNL